MNTTRQGTPWWMWALGGCGCLAILVVIGFVGVGWMGVKWAKDTAEQMADPAKREAAALERFGMAEFPSPWKAAAAFSIPMLADIVILTDTPAAATEPAATPADAAEPTDTAEPTAIDGVFPATEPQPDQVLVFASVRDIDNQRSKWRTALENGTDPRGTGLQLPVNFSSEAFAKGSFGLGDTDVTWAAYEGEVEIGDSQRPVPALGMAALIDCPGNPRTELMIWAVPREPDATGAAPEALPGRPGDENALRDLLDLFPVCGAG